MLRVLQAITFGLLLLAAVQTYADKPNTDPFRPAAIETENVPIVPEDIRAGLSPYNNSRSASFQGWDPLGRGVLIRTRFGNVAQLHRVEEPGSRRTQVTFLDEPVWGRFLPGQNEEVLLLEYSAGGSENDQIVVQRNGVRTMLTDGTSRNQLGPVAKDGTFFVFASNERNPRDSDLYLGYPDKPGQHQMLYQVENETWFPTDLSADGSRLLMRQYVSINESHPAVLDVLTKKFQPIPLPDGVTGQVSFGSMKFAPDGKSAYIACDANGEFLELARIDLETFEYTWLSTDIPWNVEEIEVHQKTGQVAFVVNEDGAARMYVLEDNKPRALELPLGVVEGIEFSHDGSHIGMTLSRPTSPSDVYSVRIKDNQVTRWTYSEVGGLDTSKFVEPQRIAYKTFDGKTIPAYYFPPKGASPDKPVPVLVVIHGGPESQYRPYFSSFDQYLLNEQGIAVIHPNVRGSDGYGKSYLLLDNGPKREDSVKDIGALLDWIAQQPELDSSRVAVSGGSYGGYMVLASLTHFPEQIRAGIDNVGIASFTTFLKNTSEYRRDLRRAEYGDERDPEMAKVFERINPTNNAHRIKSALLVAHGKNDPRVPFSEAEQIAPIVRRNNVDVWTVYADNEGHGFGKQDNREYLLAAEILFLQKHLLHSSR